MVRFFAAHRLPDMYANLQAATLGGLISYGVDLSDLAIGAVDYVDKILRWRQAGGPTGAAVQQPTKFDMAVNLKTAKAPGLQLPQSILDPRARRPVDVSEF